MDNHIGKKVEVIELNEVGRIVKAKKNWLGTMVYFVDTENFKEWECRVYEMDFI